MNINEQDSLDWWEADCLHDIKNEFAALDRVVPRANQVNPAEYTSSTRFESLRMSLLAIGGLSLMFVGLTLLDTYVNMIIP